MNTRQEQQQQRAQGIISRYRGQRWPGRLFAKVAKSAYLCCWRSHTDSRPARPLARHKFWATVDAKTAKGGGVAEWSGTFVKILQQAGLCLVREKMKARGNYVERKKMGIYVLACRFMATLCVESNKSFKASLRFV